MNFLNHKIPPPIILVLCGIAIWFLRGFSPLPIGFGLRALLGGLLIITGIVLDFSGLFEFQKHHTTINPIHPEKTSEIVQSGIYSKTRNPMYLGMVFLLMGFCIITKSSFGFLVIPIFIKYIETFQIRPEEEILSAKFGKEYDDYCQKVRRWV